METEYCRPCGKDARLIPLLYNTFLFYWSSLKFSYTRDCEYPGNIFKIICVLSPKTKDGCHQSFKVINKNYLQWLLLNFEVGFVEMT